jgi:hypothetical protein
LGSPREEITNSLRTFHDEQIFLSTGLFFLQEGSNTNGFGTG